MLIDLSLNINILKGGRRLGEGGQKSSCWEDEMGGMCGRRVWEGCV